MAQGIRRPHEAVDFAAIERMYPPPPEYFETAYYAGIDRVANVIRPYLESLAARPETWPPRCELA